MLFANDHNIGIINVLELINNNFLAINMKMLNLNKNWTGFFS